MASNEDHPPTWSDSHNNNLRLYVHLTFSEINHSYTIHCLCYASGTTVEKRIFKKYSAIYSSFFFLYFLHVQLSIFNTKYCISPTRLHSPSLFLSRAGFRKQGSTFYYIHIIKLQIVLHCTFRYWKVISFCYLFF